MPTAFDHVLLTRFSAVLAPGAPAPDPDWLWYRLQFFYDVTWPSVRSQTTRDFDWLVLLDDRCEDDFRANVEELAEGTFTPLWSREPFVRSSFAGPVAELVRDSPAGHLVTTRIDSDDAMAVDFMESVQAQFDGQDRLFVNFTRGVQLDRSGGVYLSDTTSSPFLSFIERRRADRLPETVYAAKHARARTHAPVLEVRAPVMWAQVVHDSNVSNIVNGTRTDPAVLTDRFRITLPPAPAMSRAELRAARVDQARRLGRLWTERPGELTKFIGARGSRLRGTHVREKVSVPTVEERLRDARHRARRRAWRLKNAVNGARRSEPELVHGSADVVLAGDRVVVLAEYSKGAALRDDAVAAARAWAAAGWAVVVVAARDAWVGALDLPPDLPPEVVVVVRGNLGYDYGSWRDAFAAVDGLTDREHVVLTNDSLIGPFGPLDEVTRRIMAAGTDVWAATEAARTLQGFHHYQSFLLAFRGGVLARPRFQEFFAGVRPLDANRDVVAAYEVGLTQAIKAEGLTVHVEWPNTRLGIADVGNPLLGRNAGLVEAGFPWLKRRVRDDPDFRGEWASAVEVVRRVHGVDLT